MEISQALKNHPELQVRMGIHSGPVNEVTDLNAQANIAGAGINIAQRVMDCGDAGHILLSKRVADDLEHYPRWRPHLHDLRRMRSKTRRRVFTRSIFIPTHWAMRRFHKNFGRPKRLGWQNCGRLWLPSRSSPCWRRADFIIAHIKASLSPTRTALFWRISRTRLVILFLTAHYDKDSRRSSSRHRFSLWSQIRSSPRP